MNKLLVAMLALSSIMPLCKADEECHEHTCGVVHATGHVAEDAVEGSGNIVHDTWYGVTAPFRPCCKKEECKEKEEHTKGRCHKAERKASKNCDACKKEKIEKKNKDKKRKNNE